MILDILVTAVLLVSAIIAFFRGLILEVLTILGVVGGLAAAYFGGPIFSPTVRTTTIMTTDDDDERTNER